MKIAIVTDDGKTISQHFGRAEYYEVVVVEDGKVMGRERRAKPAHGHDHHHHQHAGEIQLHEAGEMAPPTEGASTHGAMVRPIIDCQVLISRGMGTGAYNSLRASGIEPIITDVRDIDEAVGQYVQGVLASHPERLH
jgi:predicted Fe-Mo cluster-binding NifX family protein